MASAASPTLCRPTSSGLAELFVSSRGARNGPALAMAPMRASRSAGMAVCRAAEATGPKENAEPVAAVSRRLAIALVAGAAAVAARESPAEAAYGEGANIFAAPKVQSGFTSYSGAGFKVDVPAKWNPSKEVEFPGQVLRYEDNFDTMSNLTVSILKSGKSSITDYGSPEGLLNSLSYLLGKQSYSGKTVSEGGFSGDKVSTAAIMDSEVKQLNGKTYYGISVLTRTADGDEGGKHQLIVGTVDGGKLYVLKAQAGDKRWFKGAKKFVEGIVSSFNVV